MSSIFDYLRLVGFVDIDSEEDEELDEEGLEVKATQESLIVLQGRINLTMAQKKKMLNKLYEKLSIKDKKELQKLIIFGKKIEEEERIKNE